MLPLTLMNWSNGNMPRPVLRRAAVISVVAMLSGASAAMGQNSGEEHEVREAVSAFGQAYAAADVEALRELLSNDYIHVNGSSGNVLDRETWLDWISRRRGDLDAGRLVVEEYEVGDIEIRIHGETAVVVGSVVSRERRNGEEVENRLRFTNVWIRGEAGWRRAAFHDSSLR